MVVASRCGQCGTQFFPGASPGGLCPYCLLSNLDDSDAVFLASASSETAVEADAVIAPSSPVGLLAPGSHLGAYEIVALLGQGGMGHVYRARDTRLGRSVAIKVLASTRPTDNALRRLEREAQLVSHLSHPNICALFDVGTEDGVVFLVMEYLDGETLRERLRRGSLPLAQVLQYAREIAEALHEAHRHGVIHRDLKPSNIMLTPSGAKLFDFGLAKLHLGQAAGLLSRVPFTADHHEPSGERRLVGTIPYMSPEQLDGRVADPRSDLFALGLVMFEMATGQLAFHGESEASLVAGPRSAQVPAVSRLRDVPPAFEQLVETCIAKNPDERWQTATDIVLQLKWLQRNGTGNPRTNEPSRRVHAWLPWSAAALSITVAAIMWVLLRVPQSPTEVIRFSLAPPAQSAFATMSPDGRRVVWLGQDRRNTHLWVQTFDSLTATLLDDTEDAQAPFWSPDSQSIGFFAGGALKRITASVAPPVTLAPAAFGLGGAWNRDGTIVFAPARSGGLYRVSVAGGPAIALTAPNAADGELSHRWPSFLPDGRHFLYLAVGEGRESGVIHVGSLDSDRGPVLGPADSGAVYAPGGYLLFGLNGTLMAQPFDVRSLRTRGDPVTLARRPALDPRNRSA